MDGHNCGQFECNFTIVKLQLTEKLQNCEFCKKYIKLTIYTDSVFLINVYEIKWQSLKATKYNAYKVDTITTRSQKWPFE